MEQFSSTSAKQSFGKLLKAAGNGPVAIEKHGKGSGLGPMRRRGARFRMANSARAISAMLVRGFNTIRVSSSPASDKVCAMRTKVSIVVRPVDSSFLKDPRASPPCSLTRCACAQRFLVCPFGQLPSACSGFLGTPSRHCSSAQDNSIDDLDLQQTDSRPVLELDFLREYRLGTVATNQFGLEHLAAESVSQV